MTYRYEILATSARIIGADEDVKAVEFLAVVPLEVAERGEEVANELTAADLGKTRVIDGEAYVVAGYGGTARFKREVL